MIIFSSSLVRFSNALLPKLTSSLIFLTHEVNLGTQMYQILFHFRSWLTCFATNEVSFEIYIQIIDIMKIMYLLMDLYDARRVPWKIVLLIKYIFIVQIDMEMFLLFL